MEARTETDVRYRGRKKVLALIGKGHIWRQHVGLWIRGRSAISMSTGLRNSTFLFHCPAPIAISITHIINALSAHSITSQWIFLFDPLVKHKKKIAGNKLKNVNLFIYLSIYLSIFFFLMQITCPRQSEENPSLRKRAVPFTLLWVHSLGDQFSNVCVLTFLPDTDICQMGAESVNFTGEDHSAKPTIIDYLIWLGQEPLGTRALLCHYWRNVIPR